MSTAIVPLGSEKDKVEVVGQLRMVALAVLFSDGNEN